MNFGAIEENYMLNSFKYFYNVPHKFRIFKMRFFWDSSYLVWISI